VFEISTTSALWVLVDDAFWLVTFSLMVYNINVFDINSHGHCTNCLSITIFGSSVTVFPLALNVVMFERLAFVRS
jgi:hypothetical protein